MKINTVIFDMDGTVLDTLEDITDSVNYILTKYGYPERSLEEIRHFVGNGAVYLMERALPSGKETPDFDKITAEYQVYYKEHCNIKTGPYKHIKELMAELKNRGYKMAIVSNKPMASVVELNNVYYSEYIDVAIGVTEGLRRKPYPDECLEAMKLLKSDPATTIYVGDSEVDHKTAVNTGLKCISCLWGFRTKEELVAAGAGDNLFAEDPLEILDILDNQAN